MINFLDARALFEISLLFSVLMSLVFFVIARGAGYVVNGLKAFAYAYAAYCVFGGLLLLRGILPDFVTIVIADMALALAILLIYDGMSQLNGLRRRWHFYQHYLCWCLAGFIMFTFVVPSFRGRMTVVLLCMLIVFTMTLTVLRDRSVKNWQAGEWIVASSLLVSIFAGLLRSFESMLHQLAIAETSIFAYQGSQALYLLINLMAIVFIAMGLIVLSQDRLRADLENIAAQDALTGVQSRRLIMQLLDKLLASVSRQGMPLAVLMVDIDYFKSVNDQYGHRAGDEVLVSVVRTLERNIRKDAFIGRYGGEEFLLLLPDTDLWQLESIADRLRQSVACSSYNYRGNLIQVTISIGAIVVDKHNVNVLEDPLMLADRALYAAKKQGRDCFVIYGENKINAQQQELRAS
ncbi:MAG: diguanylate cyclase [Methylophaga sp.]|nr:diguanylate cyclase [Methylophaga sp.]